MPRGHKTKPDKKYRIIQIIERGEIIKEEAAIKAGVSEKII